MPQSKFVEVVAKSTKAKQRIPRAWLDHPVLGRDFELPPSTRDTEVGVSVEEPAEEWTVAQLETYAATHGIDLAGATRKADILAAIDAAPTPSEPNQGDDETPATGDDKEK